MKFKLLSTGQKFEFEGEVYVKISPIIASNVDTAHNRMIPRYAVVKLLDQSGKEEKISKEQVNAVSVMDAFNQFYEKCLKTLEDKDLLVPEIKDELDNARDVFIQSLK